MANEDNANEAWFDALVRHQIGLLRVSGRVRNEILAILDATEADIAMQIRRAGSSISLDTPAGIRRLERLLETIRNIRSEAWTLSAQKWREEILAVAQAEPAFLAGALRTLAPAQLELLLPSVNLLTAIVNDRPFEGKVLREWARDIRRADLARIEQAIKIGITQGEPAAVIARRVVGTAALKGRNGVTEITRRQAQAITRTAINSVTNQAKREFFNLNADIFQEELYVATLDARTTPVCRANDGKTFPVGKGPIPPLHFNCRSLRVAVLDGEAIGKRPSREFTERRLLDEYNRTHGTSARRRADLPRGHKGEFDRFSQRRRRELTGQVDAKVSYRDWLSRQSAEFQDDILGQTRGRLFRQGKLPLDKFVNRTGDELTLAELAIREKAAFKAAGLDPEDFL